MTTLKNTALLAAIAALFLGCSGTITDSDGSTLSCYDTDEGVICHEGDGDNGDDGNGDDHNGDDHNGDDDWVCDDVGCEEFCQDTEYGYRCVTECEGGLRCVTECEVNDESEETDEACHTECTCPEGDGGSDDGGDDGGHDGNDDGGGDDGGDGGGDGGGDEPAPDEPAPDA